MSDVFLGQTCSEAWTLTSGGAAYTLVLSWQADMVIFDNITQWTNTAGNLPRNFWFRTVTDLYLNKDKRKAKKANRRLFVK